MNKRLKCVTRKQTKKHTTYVYFILYTFKLLRPSNFYRKRKKLLGMLTSYGLNIRLNLNIFFKLCRAKTIRAPKVKFPKVAPANPSTYLLPHTGSHWTPGHCRERNFEERR